MESKYRQRFLSLEERFWQKVEKTETCWMWLAGKSSLGYGYFWRDGHLERAHRVSYELTKGPVPKELELDHLCRVTLCVNPDHLEAVTAQVNTSRATNHNRDKVTCPQGHPYTKENTYTYMVRGTPKRYCAVCTRERTKKRYWQEACKKVMNHD